MTIFGATWAELTRSDIESFLADAPPEPLQWEAKLEADKRSMRKAVCGFANSHEGGYLILGVEAGDQGWSFPGTEFGQDDPPSDVTDVLANGGVIPYPDGLDVRSWPGDVSGCHIAVVWVPPIATPPCTTRGTVYERVAGKTMPVASSTRLAELFNRGDLARATASEGAYRAARRAFIRGRPMGHPVFPRLGFGLTAAAYEPNISSRLFNNDFESDARTYMEALPNSSGAMNHIDREVTQESVLLDIRFVGHRGQTWSLQASRDGAIDLFWNAVDSPADILSALGWAWQCGNQVLNLLGPRGPRYLRAIISGGGQFPPTPTTLSTTSDLSGLTMIARDALGPGDNPDLLNGIDRELRRALGEMALEP